MVRWREEAWRMQFMADRQRPRPGARQWDQTSLLQTAMGPCIDGWSPGKKAGGCDSKARRSAALGELHTGRKAWDRRQNHHFLCSRGFLRSRSQASGTARAQRAVGEVSRLRCGHKCQVSRVCPLRVQGGIEMHFCPWPGDL